jgi:hypothetical protein
MSNLQKILEDAKAGLMPWEPIPKAAWQAIADQCGAAECLEIQSRIQSLKNELASTEDWDGDTQDDINSALWFFKSVLALRPT